MARAIELSRMGYPAPNPRVGCVLVRDGKIVGEGFHALAGGSHAEVAALLDAGPKSEQATTYVTLEPCDHVGRTGPCSVALIDAGVCRVIYAVADPNPKAKGGAARLREAGVAVDGGLLESEAAVINERFLTAMRLHRPFVIVKAAITLDGRIALPSGESQWITGESARLAGRWLRKEMGAVLVGPGTVLADDPHLTPDVPGYDWIPPANFARVVLDPRLEIPSSARVFDAAAPTLHVVPEHGKPTRAEGGSSLRLPLENGRFPIPLLLEKLFELGHTGLLVEGGGRTIGSFFQAGCVDAIELFVAPKVLGEGPSWVEAFKIPGLGDAPEFKVKSTERLGDDLHLSLRKAISSPPLAGEDLPRPRG